MANALLERTLEREAEQDPRRAGWAVPQARTQPDGAGRDARVLDRMTMGGIASATTVLFVVLLATGAVGWWMVEPAPVGEVDFPGWIVPAILVAAGVAVVAMFRPPLARYLAPLYAAIEGLVLGAISHVYENQWDGIVIQAVLLTAIVFATMLFLYSARIVRVTERMRRVVVGATIAIGVFYLVTILLSVLGTTMPLVWDAGPLGIAFSVFVAGLAAFNLMLDFDIAERGVQMGLPRNLEWFVGLGLMVSIVWLYLEILRLLAKLRR